MANRESAVTIETQANRWVAPHAPAAGTTCSASVAAAGPRSKVNLVSLTYSIVNNGAAATFTVSVRDSSIAGNTLWSFDVLQAAGTGSQNCFANIELQGRAGNPLEIDITPPGVSVTQKVAACGWHDSLG